MKPTVYVETSVISYVTARPSRDLIVAAHQQLTHEWWELALPKFEGFISNDPLISELRQIRLAIDKECEGNPQRYYEYFSQTQLNYADRLVRRKPKPRLRMKEHQT